MKIMQKIRSLSRKTKLLAAVLVAGVAIATPFAVNAEFTPNRPTYDYNKYNGNNNCTDPNNIARDYGRCGSMTGPVFNSFVNTPFAGDERSFFYAMDGDRGVDPATNVSEVQEVVLKTYIHNNANDSLNCAPAQLDANGKCKVIDPNAPGVAKDVKVRINLSDAGNAGDFSQVHRARSYISASNATTVTDSLDFTAGKKFTIEYVPNSAVIYTDGAANGKKLDTSTTSIVTTGVNVGFDDLSGNFPGCFDYRATVEIRVKIKLEPVQQITKQVKKVGDTGEWKESVDVKPGDKVQWLISTKNIGFADLTNVTVNDVLPPHISYDPSKGDKVQYTDQYGTHDQPKEGRPLFDKNGFDFGTYKSGGAGYVVFTTTALGDFEGCEVRVRNIALIRSTQIPEQSRDTADVVIKKEKCKEEPDKPKYSCDLLTKEQGANRYAKFTVNGSASGGATVTRYFFNFGDGTEEFRTTSNVAEHTYARDGQYAVRAKVEVRLPNGELRVAEGDKCVAAVTFTGTPPTTPGKPTTLPNTGAGDAIAIFIGVAAASTAAYYVVVVRRLSV